MFVSKDRCKMRSCFSNAFSRCIEMRTFDPVFQVLKTEKEKQDIFHHERIDDLLDKQSRELQDLGEFTSRGHMGGGGWLGAEGLIRDSKSPAEVPGDMDLSINGPHESPGTHHDFYSYVFTHSLNMDETQASSRYRKVQVWSPIDCLGSQTHHVLAGSLKESPSLTGPQFTLL